MKYRLKDKELQKKLDEISDGDFTKCLEYKSERFAKEFDKWRCANVRVDFGKNPGVTFSAILHLDDLEEVPTYDPSSWNDFPAITPPEGVWMRCERFMDDEVDRRCLKFINNVCGSHWVDCDGLEYRCDRFRPWDSEQ